MTLTTPPSHLSMINFGCRPKRRGIVTRLAEVGAGYVTGRFAGRIYTIVAAATAANNSPMIKTGGNKCIGVVAHFAC